MTIIVTGINASAIENLERAFTQWAPEVQDVHFQARESWMGVVDLLNSGSAHHYLVIPSGRLPFVQSDIKPEADVFIVWPNRLVIWHSGEVFSYPAEVLQDSNPEFARVLNAIQMAKRHQGPDF